jgi:hypothetical protein
MNTCNFPMQLLKLFFTAVFYYTAQFFCWFYCEFGTWFAVNSTRISMNRFEKVPWTGSREPVRGSPLNRRILWLWSCVILYIFCLQHIDSISLVLAGQEVIGVQHMLHLHSTWHQTWGLFTLKDMIIPSSILLDLTEYRYRYCYKKLWHTDDSGFFCLLELSIYMNYSKSLILITFSVEPFTLSNNHNRIMQYVYEKPRLKSLDICIWN